MWKSEKGAKYSFSLKQTMVSGIKAWKMILVSFFMEKQLKNPSKNIVDKLPFKEIIKTNMHKSFKKHEMKEAVEQKMEDFIITRKK